MPPNQTHYFTYCQIKAHQFKNPVSLNRMRQGQNQTPYHYGGTFKTALSQCDLYTADEVKFYITIIFVLYYEMCVFCIISYHLIGLWIFGKTSLLLIHLLLDEITRKQFKFYSLYQLNKEKFLEINKTMLKDATLYFWK